ncbi:hypothetical protein GCM10022267_72310 [Lentzea roselyniae]|uniref:Uncharacterized protein n=1 Tax=Lentzea roselyniae TaxID=531940 RepID=A0ABP7C4B2_9PSEU
MSTKKTRLKGVQSWVPEQLEYLIAPFAIDTEQSAIRQRIRDLGLN